MSAMFRGTPPKIGLEVEANWPAFTQLPNKLRDLFASLDVPYHRDGTYAYSQFVNLCGSVGRHRTNFPAFYEKASPEFYYPIGWDKGSDSGVEMRFDGPATTLEQAEALIKTATKWLSNFGFSSFAHAGTHVHLGHKAWCDEMFGTKQHDLLRGRAETALWAYFATREKAIFSLSSAHRASCGYCYPIFRNSREDLSPATPLWAIHNFFMTRPTPSYQHAGLLNCTDSSHSLQMYRKNLPTIEFRHFPGTKSETAIRGYVRLVYEMFKNAAAVLTEENLMARSEDAVSAPILMNPFKFTVADLRKEITDPWLLKWIDLTIKNSGEPIDATIPDDHSVVSSTPQAVAAA